MRWCENIRMCLLRKIKNIKSENSAKKFGGIKKSGYLCNAKAETLIEILAKIAQLVEHDLAKVGVAGSSPVFRSARLRALGVLAAFVRMAELVDALL